MPQTRFLGSVPEHRKKGTMAWKGTTGLRTESEASKVHVWLKGGPILSGLEVCFLQKPNDDAQTRFLGFVPKRRNKGTMA